MGTAQHRDFSISDRIVMTVLSDVFSHINPLYHTWLMRTVAEIFKSDNSDLAKVKAYITDGRMVDAAEDLIQSLDVEAEARQTSPEGRAKVLQQSAALLMPILPKLGFDKLQESLSQSALCEDAHDMLNAYYLANDEHDLAQIHDIRAKELRLHRSKSVVFKPSANSDGFAKNISILPLNFSSSEDTTEVATQFSLKFALAR